jgi:hypothetical protein
MAVYGHTVDHGWWWSKGSLESSLAATLVGKTSPRAGEKRDKTMGNLSKGGNWRLIGGMRPTSKGEWNMALVLGVRRLGAQISGARRGEMLWVKWPWLRAPFIASGRWGEGSEEVTDRRQWKFNTGNFRE